MAGDLGKIQGSTLRKTVLMIVPPAVVLFLLSYRDVALGLVFGAFLSVVNQGLMGYLIHLITVHPKRWMKIVTAGWYYLRFALMAVILFFVVTNTSPAFGVAIAGGMFVVKLLLLYEGYRGFRQMFR